MHRPGAGCLATRRLWVFVGCLAWVAISSQAAWAQTGRERQKGLKATGPKTARTQTTRRRSTPSAQRRHARKPRRSRPAYRFTASQPGDSVKRPRPRSRDLSLQIATGLNAGYARAIPEKSGTTRNAMAFSMMVETRLNQTFYLCPELAFVQRGVQTELLNLAGVGVTGDIRLNTLELPLLLKAKLWLSSPRWKVFFAAGPSIALALHREVEVLGLVRVDLSSRFAQWDLMAVVGTGVEYAYSPTFSLHMHLRHHIGLIDIDSTESSFYTRGIQLLFGAQFRL